MNTSSFFLIIFRHTIVCAVFFIKNIKLHIVTDIKRKDQKTAHKIVCRNIINKKLEMFICPSTKKLQKTVYWLAVDKTMLRQHLKRVLFQKRVVGNLGIFSFYEKRLITKRILSESQMEAKSIFGNVFRRGWRQWFWTERKVRPSFIDKNYRMLTAYILPSFLWAVFTLRLHKHDVLIRST